MMSQCSSPLTRSRDRPRPHGRESHHAYMSHELNSEPGGSREILMLRRFSKVMEHQHGSGRGLLAKDRPSGGVNISQEKKN